jgi:hypothetical protein
MEGGGCMNPLIREHAELEVDLRNGEKLLSIAIANREWSEVAILSANILHFARRLMLCEEQIQAQANGRIV